MMISKVSTNPTYDAYYELPEVTYENDEVNADDDNTGEYVLERKATKLSVAVEASATDNRKPGHKPSEAGVYDELDYNLNPRIETNSADQTIKRDRKDRFEKKKILIALSLVIFLSMITIGVIIALQGNLY